MARLGPGGRPDRTFGDDGLARVRFHGHSALAADAVSAGSTLVVAGVEHKLGEPFVDQDGRLIFAGLAPVRERRGPEGRCLFYRDGEVRRTLWEFCVRRGRIVSASGNHHHPR